MGNVQARVLRFKNLLLFQTLRCSENDLSARGVLIYVKSARFQNHDTSLDETETIPRPDIGDMRRS
jgi:hypothetical protein